jgi:hypothetical protein
VGFPVDGPEDLAAVRSHVRSVPVRDVWFRLVTGFFERVFAPIVLLLCALLFAGLLIRLGMVLL